MLILCPASFSLLLKADPTSPVPPVINIFDGMINIRQFYVLVFILTPAFLYSQNFDQKITAGTLTLPNRTLEGFQTAFDFEPDKVQKGWWKYAKQFALPKNQRTHYEITIPGTEDSSPVIIFTQVQGEESSSTFKLAVNKEGLSDEDKKKYSDQAKSMLLDFKRSYYLRHYEAELNKLEKSISRKGKNWDEWMVFVEKRRAILEKMKGI